MLLSLIHRLTDPGLEAHRLADQEVLRVVDDGLGPVFQALLRNAQITCTSGAAEKLEAADLTARVISSGTRQAVQRVCKLLAELDIRVVLLKGMDVATRYYPQPHLRIMGDIDLLLETHRVQDAVDCLKANGFTNPTEDPDSHWADHHHAVPLWHADHKVWVELHRKLVTDQSPFAGEPLLSNSRVWRDVVQAPFGDGLAWFLDPPVAYAHTVAHWYFDLIDRWGSPGSQRQIVDLMFMRAAGVAPPSDEVSPGLRRALGLVDHLVRSGEGLETSGLPWAVANRIAALANFRRPSRDLWREVSAEVFAQYLNGDGAFFGARLARRWAMLTLKSLAGVVSRKGTISSH